jgi:DNA-binding transcriptional regulator YiaG
MKLQGKYRPLFDYLARCQMDEVTLTFADIEWELQARLPASARTTRGWWSNRGRGSLQAAAWMEAGYEVRDVDLARGEVMFRRLKQRYEVHRSGDTILWDGQLVRALRDHMGMSQTQLADTLGMRQQTVSEWETGMYTPTRATSKFLTLVAERAGFTFGEGEEPTEKSGA